jgi:hypothetical protein
MALLAFGFLLNSIVLYTSATPMQLNSVLKLVTKNKNSINER